MTNDTLTESLTLGLTKDQYEAIQAEAERRERSMNYVIRDYITQGLQRARSRTVVG